jgi:hypothetical protein
VPIGIEVPAGSVAAARSSPLNIDVQACNLEICLAPATISVPLTPC